MPYYITLLEGPTPAEARAVLATEDARIVQAVLRAIRHRLPALADLDAHVREGRRS